MANFSIKAEQNLYKTKPEGVYPVTESDWNRLKDFIDKIVPEEKLFSILASVFGGVFVSSVFFLISFLVNSDIVTAPLWIMNAGWIATLVSLIVCIGFIILDRQQKRMITISKEFILREMKLIEEKYIKS